MEQETGNQDEARSCDVADRLQESGGFDEAVAIYHRVLAANPASARAWYSTGCAENARRDYLAAAAGYQKAVALRPDWLEARHNLAQAQFEIGQTTAAMANFRRCGELPGGAVSKAMIAIIIPGAPEAGNRDILAARRACWAEILPQAQVQRPAPRLAAHRRLRIGYVSSFFHRRNWMKPDWPLINQHDRQRFQIHLFWDGPSPEVPPGDSLLDISGLSNEAVATRIRQSEIDILVDLNGYSCMRRLPLFTLRPAPVIVGWFNMYATTGMECFDYLIGDDTVVPAEEEQFYVEKIVRVAGSYLTFAVEYPVPDVSESPCVKNGAITFGCLASQYKITSQVIATWSLILQQSPRSSLLLRNACLAAVSLREFLFAEFGKHGIARDRLRFAGPAEHFDFLATYAEIDIALDTFPYNGGTTTTEALWQGVPVLTFWGDRWVSRTSASLLRAAGMDELVADDVSGYVAKAAALANTDSALTDLTIRRGAMRERLKRSRVCDVPSFTREIEHIYSEIGSEIGAV